MPDWLAFLIAALLYAAGGVLLLEVMTLMLYRIMGLSAEAHRRRRMSMYRTGIWLYPGLSVAFWIWLPDSEYVPLGNVFLGGYCFLRWFFGDWWPRNKTKVKAKLAGYKDRARLAALKLVPPRQPVPA